MTGSRIHAIPTSWNGINFRSRLEAKHAIFMHALGWRFDYEAIDLESFRIPDFLMDFRHPTLLECKPAATIAEVTDYRRALVTKAADWLCADAELELRNRDADARESAGDLARIDELVEFIASVRDDVDNSSVPGRRALVVGSRLFIEQQPDCVSIDGEHKFARGEDHVGLVDATGWCLVCGRSDEHQLLRSADVLAVWIDAGNRAMWKPPA